MGLIATRLSQVPDQAVRALLTLMPSLLPKWEALSDNDKTMMWLEFEIAVHEASIPEGTALNFIEQLEKLLGQGGPPKQMALAGFALRYAKYLALIRPILLRKLADVTGEEVTPEDGQTLDDLLTSEETESQES